MDDNKRGDVKGSRYVHNDEKFSKVFSKQAVPPKSFQNTASHSAVPLRKTFQNTANFRNSFNHHRLKIVLVIDLKREDLGIWVKSYVMRAIVLII